MAVAGGGGALLVFGLGYPGRVRGSCLLCLLGGWIVLDRAGTSIGVSPEAVGARETIASSEVAEAAGGFSTVLRDIFQSSVQVSRFGRK